MTWHQRTYTSTNVLLVALLALVFGSCASSGRTVEEGEAGELVVLTTVPAEESEGVADGADPRPDPGADQRLGHHTRRPTSIPWSP